MGAVTPGTSRHKQRLSSSPESSSPWLRPCPRATPLLSRPTLMSLQSTHTLTEFLTTTPRTTTDRLRAGTATTPRASTSSTCPTVGCKVTYTVSGDAGFVADVVYTGEAQYPPEPAGGYPGRR